MKKIITFFIAVVLSAAGICAVELEPSQNSKGKWGFVNTSGSKVIDYKYDAVKPFDGKYAKVCKKDKWGFIDASGKEVLKPEYEEITQFDKGVARVKKGKKYGYINENLQFVVPCKFSAVGTFNGDDLVWVQDGKNVGIYRKNGDVFIEPKYKSLGVFVPWEYNFDAKNFEKNSYAFTSHYRLNGSHKLFRKRAISHDPFSKIPEKPIGYYYSTDGVNGYNNSVVDPNGKVLIEGGKYRAPFYPEQGIAPVFKKQNKFNFLNLSTGKWLLKDDAIDGWAFNDNVAIVKIKDGKNTGFEFVNKDGFMVSSGMYDVIFPRVNDVYILYKNGKFGMADCNGRVIISPTYAEIISTTGQYFAAKKNEGDQYGFLNNKGEWIVEPKYTHALAYEGGFHCINEDGKWGALDSIGNEIVKCEYASIIIPTVANQNIFWVSTDTDSDNLQYQAYSVIDKKFLFPEKYKWVNNFDAHFPGVALVCNGEEEFGCIDKEGTIIVPLELTNIDMVKVAYQILQNRDNKTWRPIDTHRLKLSFDAVNKSYKLNQLLDNENWEY